ncbi:Tetratricopeptide repeat-containing protein [Chishuiella changwenlii]|uniref:Tetratricopeptide repeat-containing protein n=2 Tax=Chishuiella changwenlii TaxID=1434701 RepID=A0A1M7BKR5_9FLAO|nr:tetratricopeptide repeat protein [Chishuiella changwenlii]SHL55635.1 Tetratricopeptide repeat-containing protein [Chishuiella changwenlii]
MGKLLMFFKILLLIVFTGLNTIIVYGLFFTDKEERFEIAGDFQGMYFSDFLFSILNKQYPSYSKAFMERSVAFNKIGKFHEGFLFLDKAVELTPVEYLGYRGWLKYEYLRDYNGAIKDFKTLDSLTPNFIDHPWGVNIYQLLGNSYAANKDYKNALMEYEKYLNTTDKKQYTGEFFMFYGKALENSNKYNEALNSYSKAVELDSLRADHHYYKATLLFKLKEYKEAKLLISTSLELYNKNYSYKDPYNELYMQINKRDILKYKDSIEIAFDRK